MAMTPSQKAFRYRENVERKKNGMPPLPTKGEPGFDPTIGLPRNDVVANAPRRKVGRPSNVEKAARLAEEHARAAERKRAKMEAAGAPPAGPEPEPLQGEVQEPRARGGARRLNAEASVETEAASAAKARPSKRKGGGATVVTDADVDALGLQVFGAHQILAGITGLPELAISGPEAKMIAAQSMRTANAFGLDNIMDSKWWALGSLAATCGAIYWPRFNALTVRLQAEAARNAPPAPPSGQAENPNPQAVAPANVADGGAQDSSESLNLH